MTQTINISGLVAMIVFYALILVIGLLAAWFKTRRGQRRTQDSSDTVMVADRDIGLCVGIFTMTATWVGGGYINGTAEIIFTSGILYAQAPVCYSLSLLFAGLFFAGPMRSQRYLTLLDPFQNKYGNRIGALLFIPAMCADLFWTAAILNALGSAVSVVLHISFTISVIASACVAVAYTFFGGLYSVAYTDVVQLLCIILGLIPCIPYALQNEHVHIGLNATTSAEYTIHNETVVMAANIWGHIPNSRIAGYIDDCLLLICGGIPAQPILQRILSSKTVQQAKLVSCFAAVACFVCAIPAGVLGYIARFTDWNAVGYPQVYSVPQSVLPSVIQYLTTPVVSFIGLGAVSAAVMSSSDSAMLSISSMFSYNIYKRTVRPKAADMETVWVLRACIIVSGVVASVIGIYVQSVYTLFFLCGDLVYVLLFPQFIFVIYVQWINGYGVICGFLSGLLFRILMGEALFKIPAIIDFNYFPKKTIAMLVNSLLTVLISLITQALFVTYKRLGRRWDFLNVFHRETGKTANELPNDHFRRITKL